MVKIRKGLISLKGSNVFNTIEHYQLSDQIDILCNYNALGLLSLRNCWICFFFFLRNISFMHNSLV